MGPDMVAVIDFLEEKIGHGARYQEDACIL
jgi:hypothetical protein